MAQRRAVLRTQWPSGSQDASVVGSFVEIHTLSSTYQSRMVIRSYSSNVWKRARPSEQSLEFALNGAVIPAAPLMESSISLSQVLSEEIAYIDYSKLTSKMTG